MYIEECLPNLEVGDELEITYTPGNKYLGKYIVEAVYDSTFSARAKHSPAPLFFPNPRAANFQKNTSFRITSSGNLHINLIEDGRKAPVYIYTVGKFLGEEDLYG